MRPLPGAWSTIDGHLIETQAVLANADPTQNANEDVARMGNGGRGEAPANGGRIYGRAGADASPLRASAIRVGQGWTRNSTENGVETLKYDPSKHHRRSVRLAGYDYGAPGAYYVTMLVWGRACLLGEVRPEGVVSLSEMGQAVKVEWEALPGRFRRARLDDYVIMPNHMHGIIVIEPGSVVEGRGEAPATGGSSYGSVGAGASPLRPKGTQRGSLAAMMQNFKSVSTRRLNELRNRAGTLMWQRNYHEHVVRGPADLDRIRAYIRDNPARWAQDPLNAIDHD